MCPRSIAGVPFNSVRRCRPTVLCTTCAPLVCVSDVIGLLAVWRHNKPKTKNFNQSAGRRSSAGGAASCQVISPWLSSVVSSTLVEGAPGATNLTRPALVPSPLHFHTPEHSRELDSCELGVFESHCLLPFLLSLIFNKHPQTNPKKSLGYHYQFSTLLESQKPKPKTFSARGLCSSGPCFMGLLLAQGPVEAPPPCHSFVHARHRACL